MEEGTAALERGGSLGKRRGLVEASGKVVSELAPALQGTPAVLKPVSPRAQRCLAPLSAIIKTCRLLQHSYILLNHWSSSSFYRIPLWKDVYYYILVFQNFFIIYAGLPKKTNILWKGDIQAREVHYNHRSLRDFRFSQRCWSRFKPSAMSNCMD